MELFKLTLTRHSQVFVKDSGGPDTVPKIIEEVLKAGGLTKGADWDFQLEKESVYKPLDHVCQFRESHYDFICRWMERF